MMRRSATAISVVKRRNHAGMKEPTPVMVEAAASNQYNSSLSEWRAAPIRVPAAMVLSRNDGV